jgi:hypothetical protein
MESQRQIPKFAVAMLCILLAGCAHGEAMCGGVFKSTAELERAYGHRVDQRSSSANY